MKYFICLISFYLLVQPAFADELTSFQIDFSQLCLDNLNNQNIAADTLLANIQTQIDEIKDLLNDPRTNAIEISGLEDIANNDMKKKLFLIISNAIGPLMVQSPRENNLISCIYDREEGRKSFAHHSEAVPFHTAEVPPFFRPDFYNMLNINILHFF